MAANKSGIAVGLNHGHKTEVLNNKKQSNYKRSGEKSKKMLVKKTIREVAGYAPYERRVMELIKNSKDKRAKKLTKKRLGTFVRAKKKIDDLTGVIAEMRRH